MLHKALFEAAVKWQIFMAFDYEASSSKSQAFGVSSGVDVVAVLAIGVLAKARRSVSAFPQ
jgi:hypothetical protein